MGRHHNISTNAEIFLLVDVAGAGKTALAHTVARHYYEEGRLGFFLF
jgi:MoxR-like ATPase